MFYHIEFGCSTSMDVDMNRVEPQNWRVLGLCHLGWWAWCGTGYHRMASRN